jgi:hypothetical protein
VRSPSAAYPRVTIGPASTKSAPLSPSFWRLALSGHPGCGEQEVKPATTIVMGTGLRVPERVRSARWWYVEPFTSDAGSSPGAWRVCC